MIKKLGVLISVFLATACVSTPPVPEFNLENNARIGVFIELDEVIGHQHYGGFKFNNFSKETQLNWELNSFAKSEAKRLLEKSGLVYVELTPEEIASYEYKIFNLTRIKDNKWTLSDESKKLYQHLTNTKKLRAVIAYKSSSGTVSVECSNLGCAEFSAKHPGVYSRGIPLIKKPFMHAVLPSLKTVTLLEPIAKLGNYNNVYSGDHQLKRIPKMAPKSVKQLSDEEWSLVETHLKQLITTQLEEDVSKLSNGPTKK